MTHGNFSEVGSMPDYATVTGTIGAITGVIALVGSIKNYARVSAMKALDLRLELNRAFDNLDLVVSGIEGYLDQAHRSHLAVFPRLAVLALASRICLKKTLKVTRLVFAVFLAHSLGEARATAINILLASRLVNDDPQEARRLSAVNP